MAQLSLKVSSKTVLVLVVLVVLVFMGSAAGYYAISRQISAANTELAEKQNSVDKAQETAKDLDYAKLDYQDVLSQIKFLETGITNQEYVPTLLKQIEKLGVSTHLKVISINPSTKLSDVVINPFSVIKVMYKDAPRMKKIVDEKEKSSVKSSSPSSSSSTSTNSSSSTAGDAKTKIDKPYNQIFFEITVQGKYVNVLEFLYRLTSFPKIISVDSIGLSPNQKEANINSPDLRASLKLSAYLMKEEITPMENKKLEVDAKGTVKLAQGGVK